MDLLMVGGTVLCALCHFPMAVQRTYASSPLRMLVCTNSACRSQLLTGPIPQEVSLYTAPRASGPRPTLP